MNCEDCKGRVVGKPAGSYIPEQKSRTYWTGRGKKSAHWCAACWAKRETVQAAYIAKTDAKTKEDVRKACVAAGIDPKTVLDE